MEENYPSTPHLPFSPGINDDDSIMFEQNTSIFVGKEVIITEKLDGGNCCIYNGKVFSRTHKHEATHSSFGTIKSICSRLVGMLDEDLALFGENMTGIHSIEYDELDDYFYLFGARRKDHWLSWDEIEELGGALSLQVVPVCYRGKFHSVDEIKQWMETNIQIPSKVGRSVTPEGFVIRVVEGFDSSQFSMSISKYVRSNHIQTDSSWTRTWKKATLKSCTSEEKSENLTEDIPKKENESGPTVIVKSRPDLPKLIILVGIPGSGKSTFAKILAHAFNSTSTFKQWEIVSQDEIGSRDGCETALSNLIKSSRSHIILDRCNTEAKDRKYWIELAFAPKNAMAIFFDLPMEQCQLNVAHRRNHPTIPEGHGGRIVESFVKKLQAPLTKEGFKEVHRVTCIEDAIKLLSSRFGVVVTSDDFQGDTSLFKFPRTSHLLDAGGSGVGRDDLLLSADDIKRFLGKVITVEEKVDGANLGISLGKNYEIMFQNRSHYINSETATQFKSLDHWSSIHQGEFCQILEPEVHVLFGEWCYAKHSLSYTRLPDTFLAFDIYDRRKGKFLSVDARNQLLSSTSLAVVPIITRKSFKTQQELLALLNTKSQFYDGYVEGIYLRIDDDDEGYLIERAKIVRPDFIQGIGDHWSKQKLQKNVVIH
eukprot:NODE_1245_length_2050_cov_12.893098_g1053_i0.p1 GENE.NODE_1245_length_2050_cov_12.893098_g1053_i0~~NODE_1245_length_2050_cov_12.893098_g1053_i0.p1  ORF type:complete len:651 (-),score=136.80 NODE_1245_length_2050_cov_12.893098_g1053_i0:46-1998(-)